MGQIASCQYIGSFPRAQYAPPGGGGKRTLARKRVSLPSRLPKLKSNSHWVRVCVCTCGRGYAQPCGRDRGHAQPCGCGPGHLSRPYQLKLPFWKIFVWGPFTSREDERHRKRERDLFPRGNRVTENHQQP